MAVKYVGDDVLSGKSDAKFVRHENSGREMQKGLLTSQTVLNIGCPNRAGVV